MATTPSALRLTTPFLPVGAALFCIQLDFFSLSLALPSIATGLSASVTDLQWLLSGYMIALGALLIPAGRAGDILGRRAVLLIGLSIFGVTSLICGLASQVPVLIAARVAQGAGAALIFPNAFALVTNATSESDRPRIIGTLLGLAGTGTALGPVVGGVLASTAGWRWVFLLNVPIAALAVWGVRRLAESRDESGPRTLGGLDWPGVATIVAGLALVTIAIDDVSADGLLSVWTLPPLLVGAALLVAFGVIETRVDRPLVRPSLVRNHVYVVLLVAGTIANIGTCVYILGATLDLQNVRGLSPASAGLAFFVSSVGLALCGPLAGRLSVRYPAGIVMAGAVVLSAPALALLALAGPLPLYICALAFCGITTGMGYALSQLAVQNVLPPDRSAEGTSVMLTVLISVGGIAVVAATAVIEAIGAGRPTASGVGTTLYAVAGCLLLAGVVTAGVEARRSRRAPAGARQPARGARRMQHGPRMPPVSTGLDLPPGEGVLPNQLLDEAIAGGVIDAGAFRIPGENVQPASLDLRLGEVAYRIRCSFLPANQRVDTGVKDLVIDELNLHGEGVVLETGRPYLIPLKEHLALPPGLRGKANPKSSTGRVDVFTRVITDGSSRFDEIAPGYHGGLYLEVVPLSFPVRVREDLSLNQLRLSVGRAELGDEQVRAFHRDQPVLFSDGTPVPADELALSGGLFLGLDLRGNADGRIGYRARASAPLLDMTRVRPVDTEPFWESVTREAGDRLVLVPKNFFLLMSYESVAVPPSLAAEMTAYDPTSGELRTHYAGFFDPGFGYDADGASTGSTAALEVRAHDVPFMVEHRQRVCKLTFERMLAEPTLLYGQGIGSNYQHQTETLGKHFRVPETRITDRTRPAQDTEPPDQLSLLDTPS